VLLLKTGVIHRIARALALEKNIKVLVVESILLSLSFGMFIVIWQPFVLSLGASMAALGMLGAIIRLLGSSSSPVWGWLSDNIGRKIFIILSNVFRLTAYILCIIAETWIVLIPYSVLMGLSASYMQFNPARASLVMESVDVKERATAYSVIMFASQLTSGIIAPIGGFIALIFGYKPIFYIAIVTELICILLTKILIKETLAGKREFKLNSSGLDIKAVIGLFKPDPYLRGLYISAVVDAFAWGSGSAILYGMLVKTYGFNTYQLGLMSTVLSLSWAITQIPIGKLADIYGRKIFLMASEVIGAGALIGWMISTDFTSFLILQILYGVVISTWVPTTIALLTDLAPEDIKGEAMGRLQIFRGILSFPAPFIGGILYDIWGFRAPLLLNLLGAISALFLINLLIHEEKQ